MPLSNLPSQWVSDRWRGQAGGAAASGCLLQGPASADPTFPRRSAPPSPSPWPLPAQVLTPAAPPPALQWRRGGESGRLPGRGRSRAGVAAAAGTLGGGAGGTAMGVEIETISPGDGTRRRSRGRRRGPGGEPGGWGSGLEEARRVREAEAGLGGGRREERPPTGSLQDWETTLRRPLRADSPRERRRRPGGGGLLPATAPGATGCLCRGWNRSLGYPLLMISQGQVLALLFLPCWVSSGNRGKGMLWGLSSSGQPPSNARSPSPPIGPAVGRPPAG